jgi:mono/diheme cytochrome c family protein
MISVFRRVARGRALASLESVVLAVVVAAMLSGCGAQSGSGDSSAPAAALDPREAARVDALFARSCIDCHREGGPAPFPLGSAEARSRRARQIAEVVNSGFMPPWLPTAEGLPLAGARRLSEEDRELVQRWARAGAPGADLPAPGEESLRGDLGAPDLVLPLSGPVKIPAEGIGIQHTLVFDAELDRPRRIRALAYRPSNPQALHGGALLLDATGVARRMDAAQPGAGYRSPGGMGFAMIGSLDAFSPGASVLAWPAGLGPQLHPGETISLELHLFPRGRDEEEQGALQLWFYPEDAKGSAIPEEDGRDVAALALGSLKIDIPPGESDYRIEARVTLPVSADLVSVFPMARYVCRSVRLWVTRPGQQRVTALAIDDFDLNWVQRYQWTKPIELPAGSQIEMEIRYDNSAENPQNPRLPPERVRAGMMAVDEAGFLILHLAPKKKADLPVLNDLHVRGFQERLKAMQSWRGR